MEIPQIHSSTFHECYKSIIEVDRSAILATENPLSHIMSQSTEIRALYSRLEIPALICAMLALVHVTMPP